MTGKRGTLNRPSKYPAHCTSVLLEITLKQGLTEERIVSYRVRNKRLGLESRI